MPACGRSRTPGKNDRSAHDMSKLKVVRVVTASYVVPWHMANTLQRMPADFDVTVVGQGVSIHQDAYPGIRWIDIDLNRKVRIFSDLASLWALCRFFISHRPDIVHSIMPKAGLISALAGFICRVPVRMHTFTGQVWATQRQPARAFTYCIDRLINGLNTICLTDSASQSAFLLQKNISHQGNPLPVLASGSLSGVEPSRFDRRQLQSRIDNFRSELGIGTEDFVFVTIARKSLDKGAADLLSAFSLVAATHPDAKLLFVGPDESDGWLPTLKRTTPAMFNRVINVGAVDSHEAYLCLGNVLCVPSHREGFGSIVIDAAAAGLPAIGSNIVGLVDAIDDGNTGVLFPAGDIEKLAGTMCSMLENRPRCIEMGAAAKRRVESLFTADKLYAALRAFYLAQVNR